MTQTDRPFGHDQNTGDGDFHPLVDMLDRLEQAGAGNSITFGEILDVFGKRSYGPVLLIPSLFAILPVVGALPGVSILTAFIALFVSVEMTMGRKHPWLPNILLRRNFRRAHIATAARWSKPKAAWIERWIHPRLEFLARPGFAWLTSVTALILSVGMLIGAIVPGGIVPPALVMILLALGLTTYDGVLILISAGLALGAAQFVYLLAT